MLASELRRAFGGAGFKLALMLGLIIAMAHVFQFMVPEFEESLEFPPQFPLSAFTRWLGGWSYPVHPALFYFLLPIIAALPFGWSLFSDMQHGYCSQMVTRASWAAYLSAKSVAAFFAGGCAAVLPLIVNLLAAACIFPMIQPDPVGLGSFMIYPFSFAADLFFENVLLYVLFYLILTFITAGAIAVLAFPCGCLMPNKALALLSPFIVCTVLAQTLQNTGAYSFAPTLFCRPGQDYGPMVPVMVCLFFCLTALVVVLAFVRIAKADYYG